MFISVNKKIVYSLSFLLLLLIGILVGLFLNFYFHQLQDTKQSVYMRNKYVVQLLQENVMLQNELANLGKIYPQFPSRVNLDNLDDTQKQLSHEQRLNAELRRNYNDNSEALATAAKVVLLCLCAVILLILLLIALLDYWIVRPVESLTAISHKVSQGDYSRRIDLSKHNLLRDEFDILGRTFNNMLDKTENNIKELQQREAFLQQLIDAIPDGIRVINRQGDVIMANKAFYALLGTNQSCIGQKCYAAYNSGNEICSESQYTCPLRYLAKNKKEVLRTIHEIDKKPIYVNAVNLRKIGNNSEDYIVEALHDLSGDVRFSHQQKVSSLGFLSTSIAHEMKNNLGAIRLILEGLLDNEYKNDADDTSPKKYLKMAQRQLVEAIKTPERLLRLAQFSENEISDIDVNAAISDMVMMIDYDAKRHGIEIKTDIAPQLKISGNEADFKMIILNLLQNAVKAMPDGGLLQVTAKKSGREIAINVEDNGIGIEKDKIMRIFEPFYSGSGQTKSSGLGLAIVRSLVEKAGGSIKVKSKVGKQTIFTIKLPK